MRPEAQGWAGRVQKAFFGDCSSTVVRLPFLIFYCIDARDMRGSDRITRYDGSTRCRLSPQGLRVLIQQEPGWTWHKDKRTQTSWRGIFGSTIFQIALMKF